MARMEKTLVVGATGVLGSTVAGQLRAAGHAVRAVVRDTANPEKRAQLLGLGAELVAADLKQPSSLDAACANIGVAVSTASTTLSRQPGDTLQSVDEQGQLSLIDAAEAAGVRHFVFVSVPVVTPDHPLQRAKRAVEERLRRSRMSWTILRPLNFIETWLSPGFGFDPGHGKARLLGDGDQPYSWISLHDVARFSVAATCAEKLRNQLVSLGGPDALSYHQVLQIFAELGAPSVAVEHVPEEVLSAQLAQASTPMEETYAAIMLSTARGMVTDPAPALDLLPGRLRTVREYAQFCLQNVAYRN